LLSLFSLLFLSSALYYIYLFVVESVVVLLIRSVVRYSYIVVRFVVEKPNQEQYVYRFGQFRLFLKHIVDVVGLLAIATARAKVVVIVKV
jgi:hypothetical protein